MYHHVEHIWINLTAVTVLLVIGIGFSEGTSTGSPLFFTSFTSICIAALLMLRVSAVWGAKKGI
jgi:hypothetical protein